MPKKIPRLLAAFAAALPLALPAAPDARAQTTRLHHAAQESPDKVREMLPGRGVNAQSPEGETALHWALDPAANLTPEARADIVRLLLEANASVFIINSQGVSPLHLAATGWNPAHARVLRRAAELDGAAGNPDAKDANGESPLHWAVSPDFFMPPEDRLQVVELLLAAGANPGLRARAGFTAAHRAAQRDAEALRLMLNAAPAWNFDINARAGGGTTPLHWAVGEDSEAERGNMEAAVRILLERGGDPALADENGETPLDWARAFNHPPEVIALLSAEDDWETRVIREIKKLARGQSRDDAEFMRLMDEGPDGSPPAPNQVPALHWAATYGQIWMVRRLAEAGMEVNRRNPNGNGTAAHLAAALQNAEMLAALVELGADLSLRNGVGRAPLCQPTLSAEQRGNLALELISQADDGADMTRRMIRALSVCGE